MDKLTFYKTFLNDIEVEALQQFADHPTMRQALRKVLLAGIYYNGTLVAGQEAEPSRNFALALAANAAGISNEVLGADLRASAEGIRSLEAGLNSLEVFKRTPVEAPQPNEAR